MEPRHQPPGAYDVPTYEAPQGAAWFHFLHGNVPGHQIDFIYRHVVPREPLSRQHFGHLTRMLRYIEPRDRNDQAFVIGNLSRDDTQHEPGHGGMTIVFGLRVHGAKDHAGREEPSFSHAIVAVDREFDENSFVATALVFRQKLIKNMQLTTDGVGFYHAYTSCGEDPLRAGTLLRAYVADYDNLPAPPPSRLSLSWTARDIVQPKRIAIVHKDGLPFEELAHWAGRIAAVLFTSDVRWTMISNGREEDLPNGTTIRFIPASVGISAEDGVIVHQLEDMPAEAEALAWYLFQAKPVGVPDGSEKRRQWRDAATENPEVDTTIAAAPREEVKAAPKRRLGRWFGMMVPLVIMFSGAYAIWFARGRSAPAVEVAMNAPTAAVTLTQETAKVDEPPATNPTAPTTEPLTAISEPAPTTTGTQTAPRAPIRNTKNANPVRGEQTPPVKPPCMSVLAECTTTQRQEVGK
jgi:hypothetical protein